LGLFRKNGMTTPQILYIGIDPDVDKSGFATWDGTKLTAEALKFWDLIERLTEYDLDILKNTFGDRGKYGIDKLYVRLEAGWLISKSNWRITKSKVIGERIAAKVGANHQVGKLIEEWMANRGIKYELVKPLGKTTAEYFEQLTGIKTAKTTGQDMRDAGMLVYQFNKPNIA
jgi:hypothetical protein